MEPIVDTIFTLTGGIPLIIVIIGIIVILANIKGDWTNWLYLAGAVMIIAGALFFAQALDILQIYPFEWHGTTPEETVTPTL